MRGQGFIGSMLPTISVDCIKMSAGMGDDVIALANL